MSNVEFFAIGASFITLLVALFCKQIGAILSEIQHAWRSGEPRTWLALRLSGRRCVVWKYYVHWADPVVVYSEETDLALEYARREKRRSSNQ